MATEPALDAYFQEAATWDAERADGFRRSARIAWIVAVGAALCAIASSGAVMLLTPLKTVEPFVIRVDNSTGIVDVVPAYDGRAALNETVTRYLLAHYVTTCERFHWETAESDYEECAAFHSPQRNQAWAAMWAKANPLSPLNQYRDGTSVRSEVQSVSFFKRANGVSDLAQVRFVKAAQHGSGGAEQFTHWIVSIQYAYTTPPSDPRLRRWNPLGFRIMDYRPEPEVVAGPNPQLPASGPAGNVTTAVGSGTGVTP